MDDLELPIHKLTIFGPTLSSLTNRFTSSPGDIEGLFFGQFSLHTPSSLSDDSPSPSSSVATVTGFISFGTTTSFADLTSLLRHHNNHPRHRLIGWFSGRRLSLSASPSVNYPSQTLSSSGSPCVFLLLKTPFPDSQTPIHTHEYKAYHYRPSSSSFDALPLDIVNIGPAFRGNYSAFCPRSKLPCLPCEFTGSSKIRGGSMREDAKRENLNEMKKVSRDQKNLESYAEGYELGNLSRLMGSDAVNYTGGVEDLYEKMLAKLDTLAKLVESSSAKVLHQMKRSTCMDTEWNTMGTRDTERCFRRWFNLLLQSACGRKGT